MLRHATVPLARAWNTWSSRPAEMVFLPLGVKLTPVVYSDAARRANAFAAGDPNVRLGRHATDARLVELELSHAGTKLAWSYFKPDPFRLVGSWRAQALGEWGLRFWVNLCLSSEEGHVVRHDAASGGAIVKVGHRFVALVAEAAPVQVTGHESVEALAEDYETHGYFWLGSRVGPKDAPLVALRFNLEMTRDGRFAAAVADREDLAVMRAREALEESAPEPDLPAQTGAFPGALDAVRDVIAWNSVWDPVNARPYTSISRNWNLSKFGGFGVWLNDQQYAALLAGLLDPEMARENLAVALAGATPDGNLACLLTANDAWVDRTQLPVGTFLLWLMYLRSRSKPLLAAAYEALSRNHAWWRQNRDPENRGLVSYGTSDVGEGLYKGTHFGARNESSMDNSPIHDEAEYDPGTRTLTTLDVGLNSLLALDAEMLALVAAELGDASGAERFSDEAGEIRFRIREELWDESRGLFANRLRSGAFVRSVGPTSFYPLICGAATAGQAERLMRHLDDPEKFGGRFMLPSVTRDDPAYLDNTYWRGRIWPPLNFLVWQGLRRYGLRERASHLARSGFELFSAAWETRRLCPENFNAETGEPLDQPDTEGFYTWGALLPMLGVAEVMDVDPWGGWEIFNDGTPLRLGPTESPAGPVTLTIEDGILTLAKGEIVLMATDIRGRFTHLHFEDSVIAFDLPEGAPAEGRIWLPDILPEEVAAARIGDAELSWAAEGTGIVLTNLAGPAGLAGEARRVTLLRRSSRLG